MDKKDIIMLIIGQLNKHARSRKLRQRGSNFDGIFCFLVFSLMRGGRIQIPLLTGHQWPASETPFKWRFAGGPMRAKH